MFKEDFDSFIEKINTKENWKELGFSNKDEFKQYALNSDILTKGY